METIDKEYAGKNVLVLSYHVDYWNKLGWKDEFSSTENTTRQGYYANIFRLNSIYTPQAVVNGTMQFVGSDRNKMTNAIDHSKKTNKAITLSVSTDNNKVIVDYKLDNQLANESILIAFVQKKAITDVKRGENGGRKLHHINIVREFDIIKTDKGSVQFILPGKTKADFFVIALLQNEANGSIEGYNQAAIN